MGDSLTGLVELVADVVYSLGYFGLFFLIALENLLPPIPSEVILPLAGFLVGQGRFSFWAVLVAATIGSVSGADPVLAGTPARGGAPATVRAAVRAVLAAGRVGSGPRRMVVRSLRRGGCLLRASGAGGAQLHLGAGGYRAHAAPALHRLHRGWEHALERGARRVWLGPRRPVGTRSTVRAVAPVRAADGSGSRDRVVLVATSGETAMNDLARQPPPERCAARRDD